MGAPAGERSWPALLRALSGGRDIDAADTAWAMSEMMSGSATDAQLAAFVVLLRAKGETPQELAGLVRTMLERAPAVPAEGRCVDVVGTGGDGANTVNVSTMAAILTAATGRPVVKHGNRAASSAAGAADVLEALGVVIDLPADAVARCVREAGIGFCFAPVFHAGMRFAAPARGQLGIPTVFNLLGPLSNPARPAASAVGCADPAAAPLLAAVLANRGASALVFRGDDGLDELTTTTTSAVWCVGGGSVDRISIDPTRLGIASGTPEALRGGDAAHNAGVVRELLAGGLPDVRAAVVLNAAAAIAAFDGAVAPAGLAGALALGIEEASGASDSGAASALLERWAELSRSLRAPR
ncbi:MAG: anthranilate phosphoribosyltransferase [Frankiaceae bacterium]|jgi:anthranilate phosphoribosyltransferase|nr:anthranilate phosphoribosyltransferase [Frankiaceae bacterium]